MKQTPTCAECGIAFNPRDEADECGRCGLPTDATESLDADGNPRFEEYTRLTNTTPRQALLILVIGAIVAVASATTGGLTAIVAGFAVGGLAAWVGVVVSTRETVSPAARSQRSQADGDRDSGAA